jgi:hypothetical protein
VEGSLGQGQGHATPRRSHDTCHLPRGLSTYSRNRPACPRKSREPLASSRARAAPPTSGRREACDVFARNAPTTVVQDLSLAVALCMPRLRTAAAVASLIQPRATEPAPLPRPAVPPDADSVAGPFTRASLHFLHFVHPGPTRAIARDSPPIPSLASLRSPGIAG